MYASLNWVIIGSDKGLSPVRRQAIIWTNAGLLLIRPLGTNFSEILIRIQTFSFKKLHLKTSSAKWCLFCLGLNELTFRENLETWEPQQSSHSMQEIGKRVKNTEFFFYRSYDKTQVLSLIICSALL